PARELPGRDVPAREHYRLREARGRDHDRRQHRARPRLRPGGEAPARPLRPVHARRSRGGGRRADAGRGLRGGHEGRIRHKRSGSKLGRLTAHRWALFRNLLTGLFTHERITTTLAKAKAVRPLADHLVTLAKEDTLHARRQALTLVPDVVVVRRLFDTVGARYADRRGGYTRLPPLGAPPGDRAPGALPGLVDRPQAPPAEAPKGKR